MKCDELKAYNVVATADVNPEVVDSIGCTEWTGYDKNEVDEAIAELKARNHELEEERRWRKFPDEKPQKYTWCLVSGKGKMGNYIVIMDFFEEDNWAENPNLDDDTLDIEWWMPLPKAPEVK